MRSFSLPLSDCGLTQAVFLGFFWNFFLMGFGLPPEFSCWNLWHENGHVFAEEKFVIFCLFVREYCSGTLPHFFRLYEKSTKKVPGGCSKTATRKTKEKRTKAVANVLFLWYNIIVKKHHTTKEIIPQ